MTEQTFASLEEFGAALKQSHPEMFKTGARKARDHWHPVFGRIYGIKPWEMGRLTLREVRACAEDLEMLGRGR